MNYVADTDVVSFIFKKDTRSAFYEAQVVGQSAAISFMTVAELGAWAIRSRWGPTRIAALESFLRRRFVTVLSNRDLCRLWADVSVAGRRAGRPIESCDAWMAATAQQLGLPLLTHNRAHFAGVPNLSVISAAP
jgi:tRNA(fMet)-specific endonuclease VapC